MPKIIRGKAYRAPYSELVKIFIECKQCKKISEHFTRRPDSKREKKFCEDCIRLRKSGIFEV